MNIEDVKKRVDKIKEKITDDEIAHGMENQLWQDVLQAIADGVENPAELAKEALKTNEVDFCRWNA